uniref:CCHC-type domain-containing protein n=1 Tax=Denticeps clupeoides TaxID=299321 RepID=A0AAY4CGI3_9TELE
GAYICLQTMDNGRPSELFQASPKCRSRGCGPVQSREPDVCFRCNQRGHWARDCTKRWRGQWRPRSEEQSDVCFNCGQSGHWLRECPNEERGWSRGHGVPYGERRGHRGEHTHHEQSQTA